MMEIAASVGVSKRTLYAKYEDKAAIFETAVLRAVERYAVSIETLQAAETEDLEATLLAVARIRIANLATSNGIKLQSILNTLSYRFPELSSVAYDRMTRPAIEFLSDLLTRHSEAGDIDVIEPQRTALAFLSLVIGGPARIIMSRRAIDTTDIEKRITFSVGLFLNGIRRR